VDRRLADSMSTYWVNFVTTGDPNMRGLPRWEPYDLENEPYLEFAGAIRQGRHLFRDRLDFQERFQNRVPQVQTPPAPPARPAPPAQTDPVVGNWRGTLKNAQGVDSPIIITFAKKGDGYAGSTNGLNATSEIPLKKLTVDGARVSLEASAESRLGDVVLTSELTADGNAMRGAGVLAVGPQRFDVTLALQRRPRAEVIQPHVEQRADYFAGRWRFEYLGAESPPISTGSRSGTATFASDSPQFVTGHFDIDAGGRKYQETVKLGLDPGTHAVVFVERRSDGFELASVGNWRSPIAITFLTSPVQAGGKMYQLRRVISVTSNNAFEVTEELSVDGGPYKRLGKAHYTRTQ